MKYKNRLYFSSNKNMQCTTVVIICWPGAPYCGWYWLLGYGAPLCGGYWLPGYCVLPGGGYWLPGYCVPSGGGYWLLGY